MASHPFPCLITYLALPTMRLSILYWLIENRSMNFYLSASPRLKLRWRIFLMHITKMSLKLLVIGSMFDFELFIKLLLLVLIISFLSAILVHSLLLNTLVLLLIACNYHFPPRYIRTFIAFFWSFTKDLCLLSLVNYHLTLWIIIHSWSSHLLSWPPS